MTRTPVQEALVQATWRKEGEKQTVYSLWKIENVMVTDLRELNQQTIKDSYPLMNIQEILHSLQGDTVFWSLGSCGAYHAVRNKPGSIYHPLWHIPVHTNAVWIRQSWKCVQQDARCGHEEGGQGLLEVLPG